MTITSSPGEHHRAQKALTRIARFFSQLRKTAEQLTPIERWYRILNEALKKFSPRPEIDPTTNTSALGSCELWLRKRRRRVLFNAAAFRISSRTSGRALARSGSKSKTSVRGAKTRPFQPSELPVMVESLSRRPGSIRSTHGFRIKAQPSRQACGSGCGRMHGPNDGTVASSGRSSILIAHSWPQCWRVTNEPRRAGT